MALTSWPSKISTFLRRAFTAPAPAPAPRAHSSRPQVTPERRLRHSQDNPNLALFGGTGYLVAPPDFEQHWAQRLDADAMERLSPAALLDLFADTSPDISLGIWHFLRMMNPGFEVHAYKPGTQIEDPKAEDAVKAFVAQLKELYGSFDVVIGRLNIAAFLRGAYVAELVLDNRGRMPVDIATPDPYWFRFKLLPDPVRGPVYHLGQFESIGSFVDLDPFPTVRYIPIDPFPGKPYGRPLAGPALNTAIFLYGMLHDIRRVIRQSGWPRPDIKIDFEKLLVDMPPEDKADPVRVNAWIDTAFGKIAKLYSELTIDEAFLHSAAVEYSQFPGAASGQGLAAVEGMLQFLMGAIVRGLKGVNLLYGLHESTTEVVANRSWELCVSGVKSLQHHLESLLEHLFTLALQVQGLQADVRFVFSEIRAAELLRDAQVRALEINNEIKLLALGLKTQDELAQTLTDNDTAKGPLLVSVETLLGKGTAPGGGDGGSQNPAAVEADPGSARSVEAAIRLIEEWKADESNYEEETWPGLERYLSSRLAIEQAGRQNGNGKVEVET